MTLAPDGAGVNAVPGANLSYRNLTMAYLIGADLTWFYDESSEVYVSADLTGVNFSQADLTNAKLVNFTGANFTGAEVRRTRFDSGLTLAQLYSTASYQAHDLTGIGLAGNNLSGANLAGQNLTNAEFLSATLTDADFTGADVRRAEFVFATLTGADFTGADVRGASFSFSPGHDGTGITAAQLYSTVSYQSHDLTGIGLYGHDLTGANLAGQNLTSAYFRDATLTNVNFSQANLTNAHLYGATITGANLTGADVRGASFSPGITLAQLYSTASHQNHDLTGIWFFGADLTGANLAGQNLTYATFHLANLSGANLTGAEVRGASFTGTGLTPVQLYSTASYQAQDLTGVELTGNNLAGVNLVGQNLTNANFAGATLTGADFTGAEVRGANLSRTYGGGTGITVAQLYSTASYQAHNLTGIRLDRNNLAGADLAGQNLTNASFAGYYDENIGLLPGANLTGANLRGADARGAIFGLATLTGANLSHANLTNASLYDAALTGANLTSADARGAYWSNFDAASTITANLIFENGHIDGLNLNAGQLLVVRDYDGDSRYEPARPPIPITIDQQLTIGPDGTLRMVFEADAWDSTISFASAIPVTLGGTLELTFAPDVNLPSQLGRTFDLFGWSGVSPTGAFTVSSPYTWNLSNLYTTGEVTLLGIGAGIAGDFNGDNVVDAADLADWKGDFGVNGASDADGDGDSDGADFLAWQRQLGQGAPASVASTAETVPEPTCALLVAASTLAYRRRRTSPCRNQSRRR